MGERAESNRNGEEGLYLEQIGLDATFELQGIRFLGKVGCILKKSLLL